MNSMLLYAAAAVLSLGVTALLGKVMIPFLHRLKFGQTIREEGPTWHQRKSGTPTMGGLMFIIGIVLSVAVCLPVYYALVMTETALVQVRVVAGLCMAVGYGVIGFLDDFISIRNHRNLGLTEWQKLILQFAVAGAYLASVALAGGSTATAIPFLGWVELGWVYYPVAAILIVGLTNAVNFTDGIDGLNSTVTFFVLLALAICAAMRRLTGLSTLAIAGAAGCIGFLIWNFNPAKVFMGDTGSLFLGGLVAALAFGLEMPILLVPVGLVYWVEILSVVLQVAYFKYTKHKYGEGRRIFRMTPIHHHFEMKGWSEVKICAVFGLAALCCGALTVLCVVVGF